MKEHCPKCGTKNTTIASLPIEDGTGGVKEFFSCHWCNNEWNIERYAADSSVKHAE